MFKLPSEQIPVNALKSLSSIEITTRYFEPYCYLYGMVLVHFLYSNLLSVSRHEIHPYMVLYVPVLALFHAVVYYTLESPHYV